MKNPDDSPAKAGVLHRCRWIPTFAGKAFFCVWIALLPALALSAPIYATALYGEPKYKDGFSHFDYVNPNAPKGGELKLAALFSFDSLNPFILKGVKAPGLGYIFESLMVASLDEPQTQYGLIAESIDFPEDRSSATFILRKEARWWDGQPITPEDVIYSFTALRDEGDPTFRILYAPFEKVEKTGERKVTFTFTEKNNRELPSLAASMPILPKHYYEKATFNQTTLTPPLGSGPYKIASVDQGRSLVYERVKDYWGKDLPVNRGQNNFDRVRYDVYLDETVALEALKAGQYDMREEYIARNWATAYDHPAVKEGRLKKLEIPNKIPQGMQSFVFNERRAKFADPRVREAIGLTLDFEWMNKQYFFGAYKRNTSFFKATAFEAQGLPGEDELKLLEPFRDQLPTRLFTEPFQVPVTDGSGNNRTNLIRAQQLLNEAGYLIRDGKRIDPATDKQMKVEFMLNQPTFLRVVAPMRKALEKLGIDSTVRSVDDSQYQKRLETHDFDIITQIINRGVNFPGNEQRQRWHSSQADIQGSDNIIGLKMPVVDALIDALTQAKDLEALTAAGRALDRVLLWNYTVIPNWHIDRFRLAVWDKFGMPEIAPDYALGTNSWWMKGK